MRTKYGDLTPEKLSPPALSAAGLRIEITGLLDNSKTTDLRKDVLSQTENPFGWESCVTYLSFKGSPG